ncbi:winged helix-turn-helix domain-containing protein [Roseovarius salinarum]|uniref:winged helix-turn-helix domain-containing protein n=1 Tax=Roseovarius salinarum TaxID=1981892 RepID=UPI000C34D926|nr:LysR family transcriptional regulator [Roseovarius salinarum]
MSDDTGVTSETSEGPTARLRIRVVFDGGFMMGPGKADLLELIRDTGSISAAGRRMGMSYKRAWTLVETMNAGFSAPVVESTRGGARGGGARLTETGATALGHYRALEAACGAAAAPDLAGLSGLLADIPGEK